MSISKIKFDDSFFDDNLSIDNYPTEIDDVEYYNHLKQRYDALTNCNKDFVYIDKEHWYIQID